MHSLRRLVAALLCAQACTVDSHVDQDSQIICNDDSQCPDDRICKKAIHRCRLASDSSDPATVLADSVSIAPLVASEKTPVTVSFTTSAKLVDAPKVELDTSPRRALSLSQADGTHYTFGYSPAGDEGADALSILVGFTDENGNPVTDVALGTIRFDFVPPALSGAVSVTPALAKADDDLSITLAVSETLLENPVVTLLFDDDERAATFVSQESDGRTYHYAYHVLGDEPALVASLTIDMQDAAQNDGRGHADEVAELDFTAPRVISGSESLLVIPAPGSLLTSVSKLAAGARARMSFTVDEALDGDPVVTTSSPAALNFALVAKAGNTYVYDYTVGSGDAQGLYTVTFRGTDHVGNSDTSVVNLPAPGIDIDTSAPPPFLAEQLAAMTYIRDEWGGAPTLGSPCDDGAPCFSLKAPAGTATPGSFVGVWKTNSATPNKLLDLGEVDDTGGFWFETSEVPALYVAPVDGAGNVGDADALTAGVQAPLIHHEEWVATLHGKVFGSIAENPHSIFVTQSELSLSPTSLGWTAAASPGNAGYPDGNAVVVDDASSTPPAWKNWTVPAVSYGPYLSFGTMAYDASRGVSVYYAEQHTWEWDGIVWSEIATVDDDGDGNPTTLESSAIGYNPLTETVMLHGGYTSTSDAAPNDTWEYDGATRNWRKLPTATNPTAGIGGRMVWDSNNEQMLLFGGRRSGAYLGQLWAYHDGDWHDVTGSGGPWPRMGAGTAFDPVLGLLIYAGEGTGSGGTYQYFNDMWAWKDGTWTSLNPANRPGYRVSMQMAYDSARQRTVLFGGQDSILCAATYGQCHDTWEFYGGDWHKVTVSGIEPYGRSGNGLVYDSARQRIWLLGGYGILPADAWTWDGHRWAAYNGLAPASMSTRKDAVMVYDHARENVVLFGGAGESALLNDTWIWNGGLWVPGPSAPAQLTPRTRAAAAYDGEHVVVFGGFDGAALTNQTWLWDGDVWTAGPGAPSGLTPRASAAVAFDGVQVVLFGGEDVAGALAETWMWDGSEWTLGPSAPPGLDARFAAAMAYDAKNGRVVLFGGDTGSANCNGNASPTCGDVWVLAGGTWSAGPPVPAAVGARSRARLIYDATRQVLLLTGGDSDTADCGGSGTARCDDTWTLDGSTWSLADDSHVNMTARGGQGAAFDVARGQVVLAGGDDGNPRNDTWLWNTAAGSPQARVRFLWSVANATVLSRLELTAVARGNGYDASFVRAPGYSLDLWGVPGAPAAWTPVATSTTADVFSTASYVTSDPAIIAGVLTSKRLEARVVPHDRRGIGALRSSVELDSVEVRISYDR